MTMNLDEAKLAIERLEEEKDDLQSKLAAAEKSLRELSAALEGIADQIKEQASEAHGAYMAI
jgi:prefoldin subunit 5